MKLFIVDANMAVKWFIQEKHSDSAALLLEDDCVLEAPDLLRAEFGNTLWKKVRRGEITAGEAEQVLKAFFRVPIKFHWADALSASALEIAVKTRCSVYDSLYLSLAIRRETKIATADRKFFNNLRGGPFEEFVIWCEDLSFE